MAIVVRHIDEIARHRRGDVIWINFDYRNPSGLDRIPKRLGLRRSKIIHWLALRGICFEECFGFFDGALEEPYRGDICVDLPIDRSNDDFTALESMLEHPDQSPKIAGILFRLVPLSLARKNGRLYRQIMNSE